MSNGGQSRKSSSTFHFVAGLGSGTTSAILLQPADLLKTRVQQHHGTSLRNVIRVILSSDHPVTQFWRGTFPSSIRTGLGSALYFGTLNFMRQRVASSNLTKNVTSASSSTSSLPKLSNLANLTTGAIARASAGFLVMPMTVIKVRYESTIYSYRSIAGAARDILRTEGPRGFFAGFGATAVRDAPYAGLYVLFYEESKRLAGAFFARSSDGTSEQTLSPQAKAGINFGSGIVAAGFATTSTNPFDAIKTRLQLMPQKYHNMVQAGKLMLKEEGVMSLFDGLALRMGRKAVSSALAWTIYEEIIRRAERRWTENQVGVL